MIARRLLRTAFGVVGGRSIVLRSSRWALVAGVVGALRLLDAATRRRGARS